MTIPELAAASRDALINELVRLRAQLTQAQEWTTENQAIADLRREREWLYKHHEKFADFKSLVIRMRAAQKQYFKTRDRNDLIESKTLETRVDQMAREFSAQDCEGI
jgi:S-methylmethionine-dependent homocysteine/selenocysteine methylase